MPLSKFQLFGESDESDEPASLTDDARERQEQVKVRFGSLNSSDSTQLIPPQNAPLSPRSIDEEGTIDAS